MNKFSLRIVEPSGLVFAEDITQANACTTSGEITILARHAPLVSVLEIAPLTVKTGETTEHFGVYGGFIEVRENSNVVVLADAAERQADMDIEKAKRVKKETETKLEAMDEESDEYQKLKDKLKRNQTRLKIHSSG